MRLGGDRAVVEFTGPWSTRKKRHRQLSVRVRVHGRGRWRWWCALLGWPENTATKEGRTASLVVEVKSWLTDESMRGNLRHKAFLRMNLRGGAGGVPQTGRYCPVLGSKSQRCTWERGHVPMIVDYAGSPVAGVYAHSWMVPRLGRKATVRQDPVRPSRLAR